MATPVDATLQEYKNNIEIAESSIKTLKIELQSINDELQKQIQVTNTAKTDVREKDKEVADLKNRMREMENIVYVYNKEYDRISRNPKHTNNDLVDIVRKSFFNTQGRRLFSTVSASSDKDDVLRTAKRDIEKVKQDLIVAENKASDKRADLKQAETERGRIDALRISKIQEIQVIETDLKGVKMEELKLNQSKEVLKTVNLNAGPVPIQTENNTYIIAAGNEVLSPAKKFWYGVGIFAATYCVNTVLHVPATVIGFHGSSNTKAKATFFTIFCVSYAISIIWIGVLYYKSMQDGTLDLGATDYYRKMLIFVGVSVVFGLIMYWIVRHLSLDVRNEAKEKTGIEPDYKWVDVKIVLFIGCYVVILQLLCLVLLFGLFSKPGGGMGEWLKGKAMKLSKTAMGGRAKNVEFKMDHLDAHIKQYEDCFRIAEMLKETATIREIGYGNFSELVERIADIAKANKLPSAPVGRISEFYAGMMNILFGIEISSQGVTKVDNARIDARVFKIQQQVRSQDAIIRTLKGDVQAICGVDTIDMKRLADTIKKFQVMFEAIGAAEKEGLDLIGSLTPAYARYSDLLLTLKQIETLREAANNEMKNVFNAIERCGKANVYAVRAVAPAVNLVKNVEFINNTGELLPFYEELKKTNNETNLFLLYSKIAKYIGDDMSRIDISKDILQKIINAMNARNPKTALFQWSIDAFAPFHAFMMGMKFKK